MYNAEECIRKYFNIENNQTIVTNPSKLQHLLIKFAQYHVEQALKAAAEQVEILKEGEYYFDLGGFLDEDQVSEHSILNAYPMENVR